MAKRTVRRSVNSISTNTAENLEEAIGYFNFAEFKGLNTNKNYITIDQQSFEEVENVYIDQDQQLHTRPPVKRYNVIPATYNVVEIFNVNNLTIYEVKDSNNKCYLTFIYDGKPVTSPEDFFLMPNKIINKEGLYIVFDGASIKGFELVNDEWQWYTGQQLIYKPITKVSQGGVMQDAENPNLLYTDDNVRYVFDKNVGTPTQELIGQNVKVTIDDGIDGIEPFEKTIEFQPHNEKVFTKILNSVTIDADFITATKAGDSETLFYLAYKKGQSYCYLSVDGAVFNQINFPSENCQSPVLSDDGSSLFVIDAVDNTVYVMTITMNEQAAIIGSWTSYHFTLPDNIGINMLVQAGSGTSFVMMSSKYTGVKLTGADVLPFGHSPETGKCCYIIHCHYRLRTYENNVNGYSETGDLVCDSGTDSGESGTSNGFILLMYLNGEIKTYLLMRNQMNSDDTWTNSEMIQNDGNRVRMVVGGNESEFNYVILNSPLFYYHTIEFDVNWNPYYSFNYYYATGSKIRNAAFVNYINPNEADLIGDVLNLLRGDNNFYSGDTIATYQVSDNSVEIKTAGVTTGGANGFRTSYIENVRDVPVGNDETYDFKYTYRDTTQMSETGERQTYPILFDGSYTDEVWSDIGDYIRISNSTNFLGNEAFYYNGTTIPLIRPDDLTTVRPVYTDGNLIVYYDTATDRLYSSDYNGTITVDTLKQGSYPAFTPDIVTNFITIALSVGNILYWSTDVKGEIELEDGTKHTIPQLYIEDGNSVNLPDEITALTPFNQTSLGVFLPQNVHELQYDTDNGVYLLTPTKLQLGNKKGSDVLPAYDGATIFITNLKGLIGLTYQDFVQSTEQIYNYLTENIMTDYDTFANASIKLYQYKDWLFVYKQNQPEILLFDIRNQSWWHWTLPYPVLQIIFDGSEINVLVLQGNNNLLLYFDFETTDFTDLTDTVIPWKVVSQKMHFNAPNNYKHIRQLAIVTTQNSETLRYKLRFVNYHNLENLVDRDTVEYDISSLTTMIKRVNFMKTNAFQFIIENDNTDPHPKLFETPNIAIKYRITERVR